jgi:hypothetical protein
MLIGRSGDHEQMWDGITPAETGAMADLIKADWPAAIVYQNEAPGIGECNYNRMNETVFSTAAPMIPKSVDWWGYDSYAFDNTSWLEPIEVAVGVEVILTPPCMFH